MRKFNLMLATMALVLLLLNCLYGIYLLQRPLFVQKPQDEIDASVIRFMDDSPEPHVLKYQIGRSLLQKLEYRHYLERYKDGEFVERINLCSGNADTLLSRDSLASIYLAFGPDGKPNTYWFGAGCPHSFVHTSYLLTPDDDCQYPVFIGHRRLRFKKSKPLTLAVVGFSNQNRPWPPSNLDSVFDKTGVIEAEALQYGDIFLLQFEFVDSLLPAD